MEASMRFRQAGACSTSQCIVSDSVRLPGRSSLHTPHGCALARLCAPSSRSSAAAPTAAAAAHRRARHHAAAAPSSSGRRVACRASAMDVMPEWTLDQIAGLAFGGVMLAFVLGGPQVDKWVARQQRRDLGLCEECGGVYDAATCQQRACPARRQGQGGQQQQQQ